MSGYEIPLFILGLVLGALAAVLLRRLRPRLLSGSVSINDATCLSATLIRLRGEATPLGGDVCIRLYSHILNVNDPVPLVPPDAAAKWEPQNPYEILHSLPAPRPAPFRAVVWAAFGQHQRQTFVFDPPCGSGSGSGSGGAFGGGTLLSAPAARHYRLVIEEPPGAAELGVTPEVRRALSRTAVTLTYDELETTPCEAAWVEAPAAEAALRWRLTLRKNGVAFVAALELVGGDGAAGPTFSWQSRQWNFFGRSRFAAPGDSGVRRLPVLRVEPA